MSLGSSGRVVVMFAVLVAYIGLISLSVDNEFAQVISSILFGATVVSHMITLRYASQHLLSAASLYAAHWLDGVEHTCPAKVIADWHTAVSSCGLLDEVAPHGVPATRAVYTVAVFASDGKHCRWRCLFHLLMEVSNFVA